MRWAGVSLAGLILVLDQLSKWWALESLRYPPIRIEVLPFWDMVLVWNRGVSFGLFGGGEVPSWILAVVTGTIAAAVAVWLARAKTWPTAIAAGLILGGAIGNIVDRLVYGAVVDFIDWHAYGYHWPVFNIADAGISIGVAILLGESLFGARAAPKSRETLEK